MNKLSKVQRERMIAVAVAVPILMGALYFYGITAQKAQLAKIAESTKGMDKKLHDAEVIMSRGEQIADELEARHAILQRRENTMSPDRDAYAWIIDTIKPFVQQHKGVGIYSYSQADFSDVGIIPNYPYHWATYHLKGTGYYYEFGRFFADLENSYPYFRVQNLQISPNTGPAVEPENLSYTFDIVSPVVTNSP